MCIQARKKSQALVVKYLYIHTRKKKNIYIARHTFGTMVHAECVCIYTHRGNNAFKYHELQKKKNLPATSRLRTDAHCHQVHGKRERERETIPCVVFFSNTRKACAKERGVLHYGIYIVCTAAQRIQLYCLTIKLIVRWKKNVL